MSIKKIALAGILALLAMPAFGQAVSSGKVSTAAPTYAPGTAGALSLDTSGNLRVVNGGAPTGTTDVNIVEVGGNAVTTTVPVSGTVNQGTAGAAWAQNLTSIAGVSVGTTVPGALDITCVSGCVAGSGVSQGTATTAAPTYVDATNNPLSLTLAGDLRTVISNPSIPVTGTFWQATQPVSGTFWQATQPVSGTFWQATQPVSGTVGISGTVAATQSGTWTVQPGNTPNTTPWLTTPVPPTTQADTLSHSAILVASTNSTNVKNGAGTLFEISVYNEGSVIAWLKLYNSASAPTCGSGTPVGRYMIPGAASGGAGSNVTLTVGKEFTTGISYCVTTGIADADTAAVAANDYTVNLTYK